MWKGEVDASHCAQYFNMSQGKYCWINGDSHQRDEPVPNGPEPPLHEAPEDMDAQAMEVSRGYSNMPFEDEIVTMLNLLFSEGYELDVLQ